MKVITNIVFLAMLLFFGFRTNAFCQIEEEPETAAPPKKTTLKIDTSTAIPGASFSTPVYFTPAEGVQVGRLKFEVSFISANLKFVKLDKGLLVDVNNLDLKSELKTDKNDKGLETSTVTIQASVPSPESAKDGISDGVLAYLVFKVDEKGRPANITLHVTGEATEVKTGQPVKDFTPYDSRVDVSAPGDLPTVTCFFFNH